MNKQQFARLYLQGLLLQADKTDSRSRFRRGFVLLLLFFFFFCCLAQRESIFDRRAKIT